eukprot:TRINITY_DN13308_c0_g1_i2.p1 TRINITY_DN13308_c0_g1~~TRINITY_DN13308_c0_g1_i2.p1  ORF type:complete len:376 (+),score=66.19 TRINITY_DN13308_c0_g1_i2:940-2067(+)
MCRPCDVVLTARPAGRSEAVFKSPRALTSLILSLIDDATGCTAEIEPRPPPTAVPTAALEHCGAVSAVGIRRAQGTRAELVPSRVRVVAGAVCVAVVVGTLRSAASVSTVWCRWESFRFPSASRATATTSDSVRITKQSMADARVCGRWLRQFIVGESPWTARRSLVVVVDQHAADERVKLEVLQGMTRGMCGSEQLSPAVRVSLFSADNHAVCRALPSVAQWGWRVTQKSTSELHMHSCPTLRFPGWVAAPRTVALTQSCDLLETLQGCGVAVPLCFTRMLQSKACRSAIMFGDDLSHAEAVKLVSQLARAQDSFHCAHGRPAVVPLCTVPEQEVTVVARCVASAAAGLGVWLRRERRVGSVPSGIARWASKCG